MSVRAAFRRIRRGVWVSLGFVLIAVGAVGVFIPFTLHSFGILVVIGLIMVLRNSRAWRRRFVLMHRRHPRFFHPMRRLLRKEPEVWPVIWHEVLRSERWAFPPRWRRLKRWRRAVFRKMRVRGAAV